MSVTVEEEDVSYGTKAYLVVMNFASGFSISVTESAVLADRRYVSIDELVMHYKCSKMHCKEIYSIFHHYLCNNV